MRTMATKTKQTSWGWQEESSSGLTLTTYLMAKSVLLSAGMSMQIVSFGEQETAMNWTHF